MLQEITQRVIEKDECSLPCRITYIFQDIMPADENRNEHRTFTFFMNPVNTLTISYLIYPFLSYIAEFGGWVGVFLGICVIDVFDYLTFDWSMAFEYLEQSLH